MFFLILPVGFRDFDCGSGFYCELSVYLIDLATPHCFFGSLIALDVDSLA